MTVRVVSRSTLSGTPLVRASRSNPPVAQPAQDVPDAVTAQQLLLIGIGTVGDDAGDPVLQTVICSSRAGSVPTETGMLRRCSTRLAGG
jgi:hypothetical protein